MLNKSRNLEIENNSTGEIFEDDADVLISARGSLNEISWPDIPGLSDFQGEVIHSAKWNQNYEFKNKRVGVIGGGSSSIQIVPILQKLEGIRISCFVRSKTWISNPLGDGAMLSMGFDPNEPKFSLEQRKEFANNPEALHSFRKSIEVAGNTIHGLSLRDSELQKGAVLALHDRMKERLAQKPEILESLAPSFAVGCRRLTPGPGYLEALTSPNVDFISKKIKSITSNSIRLENSEEVPLDVIVCATGFNTNNIPPFPVIGLSQLQYWTGSLTRIIESEGDYIVKCIRKLQKEDYASMVPKKQRVEDFSKYCEAYFEKTIYLDDCRSWYKDQNTGRVTGLWPGSTLHALEALRSPRWEDFEYEERDTGTGNGNALSWLGNGWSVTQLGAGDPAWYLEKPSFSKAETASALINEAYKILKSPLLRAQYLLELQGIDVYDETVDASVEEKEKDRLLLLEVYDASAEVEFAETDEEVDSMKSQNEKRIEECESRLGKVIDAGDMEKAKKEIIKLKDVKSYRRRLSH
ncbi:hypothetical protein DID88_005919 [Monilinia fructigena]|uniref:Co-chaperone HscB C-terminal oligomerisation domain-containing protein n=1 Tax=Monilinia fructigena TaxID=38457 RepID=A0A395J295_9HELO|nr:hypothetical protein DID88_005919 [Monilinia fructigena]